MIDWSWVSLLLLISDQKKSVCIRVYVSFCIIVYVYYMCSSFFLTFFKDKCDEFCIFLASDLSLLVGTPQDLTIFGKIVNFLKK